jgi:hypothetical protein
MIIITDTIPTMIENKFTILPARVPIPEVMLPPLPQVSELPVSFMPEEIALPILLQTTALAEAGIITGAARVSDITTSKRRYLILFSITYLSYCVYVYTTKLYPKLTV